MHSRNGKIYQEVDLETLSNEELISILKWFLQEEAMLNNCECVGCTEDREDYKEDINEIFNNLEWKEIDSYWWAMLADLAKKKK